VTDLLNNRLRLWRAENGLTLEELGDLVGLSTAMLSRVERGDRRLAPLTRVRVARRLGVRVRELFDVDDLDDAEMAITPQA
jgi:transcriptional regulator with XRE-family HTH domain